MREGYESRKNKLDDIRLNPKCFIMGDQQPSFEKKKVQRLIPTGHRSKAASLWLSEAVGLQSERDIVCSYMKV